jgi:hypothetical protein
MPDLDTGNSIDAKGGGGVITYRVAVGVMLAIIAGFVVRTGAEIDQMGNDIRNYAITQSAQTYRLDRAETDIRNNSTNIGHIFGRMNDLENEIPKPPPPRR